MLRPFTYKGFARRPHCNSDVVFLLTATSCYCTTWFSCYSVIVCGSQLFLCVFWCIRADEVTLDTVRAEYNTGKSFVYDKCDVYGRPVMVITASKHNIGGWGTCMAAS